MSDQLVALYVVLSMLFGLLLGVDFSEAGRQYLQLRRSRNPDPLEQWHNERLAAEGKVARAACVWVARSRMSDDPRPETIALHNAVRDLNDALSKKLREKNRKAAKEK